MGSMAKRVIELFSDDLDENTTEGVETVEFAVGGVTYEIDLGPENQEKLTKALEPFVAAGRRTGGRRKRATAAPAAAPNDENQAIREWAKGAGIKVSERGRISKSVRDQYAAANS